MLYYIYSVLVVYLIQGLFESAVYIFKLPQIVKMWYRITTGVLRTYTAIGIPAVIYFLIGDMQIFADWLGRVIYVLQHLGVAI